MAKAGCPMAKMRVDRHPRGRLETRTTLFASGKTLSQPAQRPGNCLISFTCPFEGTAISVGRGTLYPFQVIGSPDIRISSFSFRPEALEGFDKNPMYKNQYCYGNNLRHITAPKGFSLKYIITYYQAYQDLGKADKFFTRPQWFDLLIGNRTVREQIMKGASEEEIRAGWQNELEAYKKMREKYLLYE